MASGGVDFKSREGLYSVSRCKPRGQRDGGVMGSGKGTNSSLMGKGHKLFLNGERAQTLP